MADISWHPADISIRQSGGRPTLNVSKAFKISRKDKRIYEFKFHIVLNLWMILNKSDSSLKFVFAIIRNVTSYEPSGPVCLVGWSAMISLPMLWLCWYLLYVSFRIFKQISIHRIIFNSANGRKTDEKKHFGGKRFFSDSLTTNRWMESLVYVVTT